MIARSSSICAMKQSTSFAQARGDTIRSRRSRGFQEAYNALPRSVRDFAEVWFKRFEEDPTNRALGIAPLHDTRRGRHKRGSFRVELPFGRRAIYVVDNGADGDEEEQAFWYWIGTHAEYDALLGKKCD